MASNDSPFWLFPVKILILLLLPCADARIHKLKVEADARSQIDMLTFGFLKGGYMEVEMTGFSFSKSDKGFPVGNDTFGFSLEKTMSLGLSSDMNNVECKLTNEKNIKNNSFVMFHLDINQNPPVLRVSTHGELARVNISLAHLPKPDSAAEQGVEPGKSASDRIRRSLRYLSDSYLMYPAIKARLRRAAVGGEEEKKDMTTKPSLTPTTTTTTATTTTTTTAPSTSTISESKPTPKTNITSKAEKGSTEAPKEGKKEQGKGPVAPTEEVVAAPLVLLTNNSIPVYSNGKDKYSFYFVVWINADAEEGLYNFYFHNCGKGSNKRTVNFTMSMTEMNVDNYLSAGEMPLPTLYFALCLVHVGLACFWLYILRTSEEGVYKLHYLMLALLFVKALALLFHGLNFHFIQVEGHHEEAFAVLYYITYLMRGMLLFITILLIGAGWAFIKHVLSNREKRIFLIVIPLQILSNVAQIIIDETEEGQSDYQGWKEVLIVVDLVCCGAILFPVIWSIRHLQWASDTDGKAAINLQKLKLFRHFYIMIVCYIYFSRIIVILVDITVPFRYEWIRELFKEVTTLVFFVFTGMKFRPASNNPYLLVPGSEDEEEDLEMDTVLTGQSGALEGLTRVNQAGKEESVPAAAGAAGASDGNGGGTQPKQRESSHEYD